jgi:peptidoglycan/LPS O-acetylase OafA/YrhL
MTALTANRPHYPALDGLRGLAILLVVFYHNFGFINYSFFGWIGVDLFFVLSGYLITDILLKTVKSPGYLRNFFARRVLRIFPLYYLSLILFLVILPHFTIFKPKLQFYVDHQWWLWTYLQNWLFAFNTPTTTRFLNHFWSLAVEEQFYLVWPFLILLIRKPKYLLWLMLVILLSVMLFRSLVWINKVESLSYTSLYTFTRIDGICIGCMVALLQRINADFLKKNTAIIVIAFAILNFIFYFLNRENDFPYLAFLGYTTLAALIGMLVNEVVHGEAKILNFIFTNFILRFLGRISYGFYIFHWPVYLVLYPLLMRTIQSSSSSINQIVAALIATVAAVLVSVISYYSFEIRFLKLKKYFI